MALSGHYICFSGFADEDDHDNEDGSECGVITVAAAPGSTKGDVGRTWCLRGLVKLAASLGAATQTCITKRTTVLVAGRGLTHKRIVAERQLIPVVSPRWLESHGRLSFADCYVPLLYGYVFCATQMTVSEEMALTSIIESNGGIFNRTLSGATSMLFVPPEWLKQFQLYQQKHGRPSVMPHKGNITGMTLPEKIRFAWATNIPVVEYTRFLSLACLRDTTVECSSNGTTSALPRSDFETIAELCALPSSVIGGVVPHTQCMATTDDVMGSEDGLGHGADLQPSRKRGRDDSALVACGDDSQCAVVSTSISQQKCAGQELRDSQKLCDVADRSINTEGSDLTFFHMDEESTVPVSLSVEHTFVGDASLSRLVAATAPPAEGADTTDASVAHSQTGVVNLASQDVFKSRSGVDSIFFGEEFFVHNPPFLQITFLGCTPRQLVDCSRMAVRCRFLRSPVVTPSTDVVIVGGEVLGDDSEKVETGVAVGGEEQKQRASILAQLHDYLRITYGIPVERIVTVEWLRECYKRMILLNVSDADVGRGPVFQAAPMPLAELPKTERFYLQPIASATVMASYEEPHRQQQQQQQLIKMKKAATRSNQRKKSGDERTAVCSADDRKRQVDGCGTVKSSDDAQKRYEADLSVVVRRVNDILTLLNGTADAASREVSTFTTALFCFIDNDFSRIGLSIVRALINYGKGMWLKKTREDWAKSLSQLNSEGCEQDTGANHQENKEQTEYNALSTLRRLSSIYKRLLRAQDDVASVTQAVSPVAVEVAVLGQLDEHNNFQHLVGAASPVGELQHVFRVIPHGDQRPPVALHVASSHRRPPEHNRCPLRFLPAVTQDYIFCSLAAGHLLQPRSCFLFYTPTPTEAGRLARRQLLRMSDGHTAASINSTGTHASTGWRQFVLSSWLGPRKNEKGPLFGVCVYFLCLMPHRSTKDHRSEVSEEVETALVLRRVLLSCLSTAVGELGGRTADAFSQEAVTHVVVVEVASILASTISHIDGDMGRGGVTTAFASIRCCFRTEEVGEERLVEALISRGSSWPREVHKGLLPQDLVKYASEGRVSLVGMEWLEASVLWGTFLDETPFTLSLQFNDKKQCGERSTTCGTVVARSTFEYSCSTPPPTPMRVTDITLLPFSSTVRHNSDSNSPRQTDNYQFDFSTPGPTPLRPTLRSPGKKREGVSPLTSPSLLLEKGGGVFEALNHGGRVDGAGLLCKSTSERNNVPCDREAIMEANEEVTENPHDPVRRTLLLDDNEGSKDGKPQECHRYPLGVCDAARCEESERVDGSPSPRIPATAQKDVKRPQRLSQLWSPEDKISGNKHCGQRPAFPTSDCTIGTPLPANAERQQINASFSAPRIYIVHDTPGKDDLREFCVKLSNPGLQGNNGSALNIGDDISNQWQPQQQHLRGGCEPARTITCVNIVNSPKDADILVTHQFSQRESVLAALAAGLWIVTPKVLEDCRANHSFGPLHNLSLYEWCPEILPHDAQWNTVQLAKQCRGRRQQRQATGQRLFENMHFVLVTLAPIATPAVTARARSLMSVLDIGGGGVTWSLCWDDGGSNGVLVPPVDEVNFRQQALGSVDPKVSCEPGVPHATPPQMLLDLVLLQIEGSVDYGCNEKRVGSCAEVKEIIILLDDHKQENVLTKQLHNDIIKVFKDAQQQLAKAKRGAQGRLQEGLRQGRQGDQPSAEVSRKALGPNCLAEGQPTRGIRPVAPAALDCDVEVTESSGDVIGRVRGMPSLRSLRVFKCDWICFTIQKRRKVPLCTVDL